ncbi:MAG: hypothetical protein M3Y49_08325, partial [Actinomycetota bacterium]|nr:hypothetical protein [Actinomycetota bacterium]
TSSSSSPGASPPVTTPNGSSSASNVCSSSTPGIGPTPSADTPARAYGSTAVIKKNDSQVRVGIKVEAPRVVTGGSFSAHPGTMLVGVQITANLVAGASAFVGSTTFSMSDEQGNLCRRSYLNGLSSDQTWRGSSLSSSTTSATGSLVYEVPSGQDLTKLVVAYNGQFRTTATVKWTS